MLLPLAASASLDISAPSSQNSGPLVVLLTALTSVLIMEQQIQDCVRITVNEAAAGDIWHGEERILAWQSADMSNSAVKISRMVEPRCTLPLHTPRGGSMI